MTGKRIGYTISQIPDGVKVCDSNGSEIAEGSTDIYLDQIYVVVDEGKFLLDS